jgi:BASS family bile acid:Na+ symporter
MATLEIWARVVILIFVVTNLLGAGMGLSVPQIVVSLRSPRFVLSALAANFVLMPALAYFISHVITLAPPLAIGILLLGAAAGAPALPKVIEFAKGDCALAVGLMVLLTMGTVAYMPLVLPFLLPAVHVSMWAIARPLQ